MKITLLKVSSALILSVLALSVFAQTKLDISKVKGNAAGDISGPVSNLKINPDQPASRTPVSGKLLNLFGGSSLTGKQVMDIGDSTVQNAVTGHQQVIQDILAGGVLSGLSARSDISSVTASGSTVTVTTSAAPGVDVVQGKFVYTLIATGATSCSGPGVVTAVTSSSYTFTNAITTCSASSVSSTGWYSYGYVPLGNNGQTVETVLANSSVTSTGIGGLCAAQPALATIRLGINNVRQGAASVAQLTTSYTNLINAIRACSATDIILKVPNSLLSVDTGGTPVSAVSTTETLVDGTASGVTATGSHVVTVASMPTSIYVAGPGEVAGQVTVNKGLGDEETVTVTAVLGNTFTATFTATHPQGFTVVAPLASAAQAYTNIMRAAATSLIGKYPNVLVLNTQEALYGIKSKPSSPHMGDQLHPAGSGPQKEADLWLQSLQTAKEYGRLVPITPSPSTAANKPVAPYLAETAVLSNYSQPWQFYDRACANPDRYTLVATGRASADIPSGQSLFQFDWPATAKDVIQPNDIIETESAGCTLQLNINATTTANGPSTRILLSGQTTAAAAKATERVNIWRARYVSSTAEPLVKNRVAYPYVRNCYTAGGGAGYLDIRFLPNEGLDAAVSNLSASDTIYFPATSLALTGGTFGASGANMRWLHSGDQSAYVGLFCQVIGTHPMEDKLSPTTGKFSANQIPTLPYQAALGFTPEDASKKAQANGYPSLDGTGKIPTGQIPTLPYQAPLGYTPQDSAQKGQINGYASLGSDGKVPSAQLPTGGGSLPSQSGQAGKVLGTDGSNTSWVTNGALPFISLASYSVDPTGSADSTDGVQAWLDAGVNNGIGKFLWCPAGTYKITKPLIVDPVISLTMTGDGYGCTFQWAGPAGTYASSGIFIFKALRDSRIDNIKVAVGSSSYAITDAFRFENSLPRSLTKRWNFGTDVNGTSWNSGTSYVVGDVVRYYFNFYFKCIANNTNVDPLTGTNHANYWVAYYQVDPGHSTVNNVYVEGTDGYVKAGFNISGNGDFGDANNDFYTIQRSHANNYSGTCIAISGASQSHENVFYGNECYSFRKGKTGVAGSSDGTVGSTGNFEWVNGYMGGNTVADFFIGALQVLPIRIKGGSSENGARMLMVAGDTPYNLPISFSDYRFSTFESMIASDHKVIVDQHPGPLDIRGCTFENQDDTSGVTYGMLGPMYFQWSYMMDRSTTPQNPSIPQFEFTNNKVRSSTHTIATLFPGKKPTVARFVSEWATDKVYGDDITHYADLSKAKLAIADSSSNEVAVSSNYTVTESDNTVRVTDTSANRTITLNPDITTTGYVPVGREITVVDGSGGANTHNITVAAGTGATIAGGSQTISTARGSITLYMGGDGVWYVKAKF